jgi:HK97 family phage portal protein
MDKIERLNGLERLALRWGRLRALLKGGNAPVGDATAWMDSRYWGEGALQGHKPKGKADAVEQFTSWVYICASLNAQSCAAVPLELYARVPEGGKSWRSIKTAKEQVDRRTKARLAPYWRTKAADVEEVTEHAFLDLLDNVNPFMNRSDLMELTILFLDLTGEAYWYVIKGKLGEPIELWPIPSQYIAPIPGTTFKDFIKGYRYERGRVKFDIPIEDIIPFSFPNPSSQYRGMGVVAGICDAVYTNSKMYEYEEALFERKARTGGVLESTNEVSGIEVDRLREEWKQRYVGAGKGGETAILPPGLKYVRDSMTNEEISFIEGRRITREEICAAFGTPIALWAQDAIRANVEGAQYQHAKAAIQPRLRKIEEKINEKLLPMFDDSGVLFCAFDDVVPEDRVSQLAERMGYVNAGIQTRNEIRADMGLEPIDGADELFIPFNMTPITEAGKEPTPPPEIVPPEDDITSDTGDTTPDEQVDEFSEKVVQRIREKLGVAT